MQIESLWKYNAKFDPDVAAARTPCTTSPEHMLPAALAVARAESWFELPGHRPVPHARRTGIRRTDAPTPEPVA